MNGNRAGARLTGLLAVALAGAWLVAALALLAARALYDQFDSDEFQHAHLAWLIAGGKVLYRDIWDHHGPLFALANGLLLRLSGAEPGTGLLFACRDGSVLATAGIAVLTWAAARILALPPAASLASAATFATLLFVQDKGAECRPDTWQNLFWMGGLCLMLLELKRRSAARAIAAGALLALAVLSNLKAGLGPFAVFLYLVLGGRLHGLGVREVTAELALLASGAAAAAAGFVAWFASQGALADWWHFNVTWNLIASREISGSDRALDYLGMMLRHQAPFSLAAATGLVFWWRALGSTDGSGSPALPRPGGGLLLTAAVVTGAGWALNNYTQFFLIFLPLWSVIAVFGARELLRSAGERGGAAGRRAGTGALLAGIGLLGWSALRFAPLEEHPNLTVQKSLASLMLRSTTRDEPIGVIWDYCGGFVFNEPVQYYWGADPAVGRAVEKDTARNPSGRNPFGEDWVAALEKQQVRFIVGRASDFFTALPADTQRYVREHYRNNGCLWKRR